MEWKQSKMCKDYEIKLQILYCVKFHGINGMVQHGTPPTKKYYKMT